MSIFDTEQAEEKIDYEVIYKKKFDEINYQILELHRIVGQHGFNFQNLEANLNDIKSMLDFVMDRQNKLTNALDVLRIHLNNVLPDGEPRIYFNFD